MRSFQNPPLTLTQTPSSPARVRPLPKQNQPSTSFREHTSPGIASSFIRTDRSLYMMNVDGRSSLLTVTVIVIKITGYRDFRAQPPGGFPLKPLSLSLCSPTRRNSRVSKEEKKVSVSYRWGKRRRRWRWRTRARCWHRHSSRRARLSTWGISTRPSPKPTFSSPSPASAPSPPYASAAIASPASPSATPTSISSHLSMVISQLFSRSLISIFFTVS